MKHVTSIAGACLSAALLSACGSHSTIPAPVTSGVSWIDRAAKNEALLYVTTNSSVLVYAYPQFALVGTLTAVSDPGGECVDRSGNVWVVDRYGDDAVEFAHGGTAPIRTLTMRGDLFGCAVNPTNGDLAVSGSPGNPEGAVFVFKHARGVAKILRDTSFLGFSNSTYDLNGDLFVDGWTQDGADVTEYIKGTHYFTDYNLDTPKIQFVGGLQYLDKRLLVGDAGGYYRAPIIYRTKLRHWSAIVVGKVPLKGATLVPQFLVFDDTVIAPDISGLRIYKYPDGGEPIKTISTPYSVNAVALSEP